MPVIRYETKYRKNEELIMSPEELLALYFYGISIRSQDGTIISNDTIRFQIKSAQQEVERYLEIRLKKKLITQTIDYFSDDYWRRFPILKTKLPVNEALCLTGFLNQVEQIQFPSDWLSTKQDSEGFYFKKIRILPTGSTNASAAILLTGITAYYGIMAQGNIPNYFNAQYITGFSSENMPYELVDLIGKLAAIKLFHIAGDLIIGAGIASLSLGIDGLSQSISTTSSATNAGYGARIIGYTKDIDSTYKKLKGLYRGINMTAI